MPTIDQLRDKAEADIARLLRRLNKDRRGEVIAAVERYGSVSAVPEAFWEELKREVDGEIAAILLLLMVPVYDNMARRVARVSPPTPEPPGRASELDIRTAAAERAAQLGREAAVAHIEYTRSRLDTAHRGAGGDAETFRTTATDIMRTRPKQGERDAAETTGITTTTRGISTSERAAANDEGAKRGVQVDVKWVTERDGKVCPICRPLDGKPSIEWVDRFPVGPPAHPNCRCDLAPYVKGGQPQQDLPYSLLPGERN